METTPSDRSFFANPVYWIMWLVPAATVVAGFVTLAIAMSGADRALPPIYHWEGAGLDADLERARNAAALGLEATLAVRDGQCSAALRNAPAGESLELSITSGSDTSRDRRVTLRRVADGEYRAPCLPMPSGRWWLALDDPASNWALRARHAGSLERVRLSARGGRSVS